MGLACHELSDNEVALWLQAGSIELHDVLVADRMQHQHLWDTHTHTQATHASVQQSMQD